MRNTLIIMFACMLLLSCSGKEDYETVNFPDGSKYVGELKNGLRDGYGTYSHFLDGKQYAEYFGEWKNDKAHGHGTYTFHNGASYVGEWKNNMKHGHGTYIFAPDSKQKSYVGEWKNDKYNGYGTLSFSDGRVLEGLFTNDRFIGNQ